MQYFRTLIATASLIAYSASVAQAKSAFDGRGDLVFVTQTGTCDQSYDFTVDIMNGNITHPNLLKFRGYVGKLGAVRASVTAGERFAAGTGKLFGASGRGTWHGHSPTSRCAGYWTARRN